MVRDWQTFQHYKDRNPPWIKLATDTFQKYDFACLQDASKLLAICIWTLAARSKDGSVPCDLKWIKSQCSLGDSVTSENLKELIDKGFLDDASNSLASCKQNACLETETEGEGETEKDNTCAMPADADMPRRAYPPEFEATWAEYPPRTGGNSKKAAYKAWCARIREGADPAEMLAGVRRYAAHLRSTGKSGTEYVKQAATFFGPNEHWRERWAASGERVPGSVGVASEEVW
jgi:hypothetical protein